VDEERTNSLHGKRVVVTRAEEQSEALLQALREKGAVPLLAPMVAFGPPDDPGLVDQAIRQMEQYAWVFLTSQNALRALHERSEILGTRLARIAHTSKIATVGPVTAEAARNAGLKVDYVAVKHQGTALAEELAEEIRGKSVLLPRSDRANPELVRKLEQLGARVKEIVAYKTVRPDDQLLAKAEKIFKDKPDAVLFFSPSAVHHLKELLGNREFLALSKSALFAAVGPVTEQSLRDAQVERVKAAKDTSVGAVLAVLADYFATNELKQPAGAKSK
jgi:uroporphyrinogen-III synthase